MLSIEPWLSKFQSASAAQYLRGGLLGLEKESLRVSTQGGISLKSHPAVLGSALTHPYITTDYSEALTEFITPPLGTIEEVLDFLCDLQTFVYGHLHHERLWATSMPCIVNGEAGIPIAEYGSSHSARMKHIYRVGLGYRYGRAMQVIAGVHVNFSVDLGLWPIWREIRASELEERSFRDEAYMGMVRNLQRFGWLIPYLFGASPAVCKSFFNGKPMSMPAFDDDTCYEPYATSLRMGDIGYQNRREEGVGVKANYDSLQAYVESLTKAIATPALIWEELGVKVNGEYHQLNANILQIENEYYSSVRPKQILEGLEKPTHALRERGVRYVELRSLDVNAYHPLGVDSQQLHFIKAFMLFCLLCDSPPISRRERGEIDRNLLAVAHRGRQPGLCLQRGGASPSLSGWAGEILDAMRPLCQLLDDNGSAYSHALQAQHEKVVDPERTPSARMLAEMRNHGESFYQFAHRMSVQHQHYYLERRLAPEQQLRFEQEVGRSLERQRALESSQVGEFDDFLAAYLAQ